MTLYVASRDRSLGGDWVRRHFEPINLTRFVVLMSTGVATSITVGLPHRRERHPLKSSARRLADAALYEAKRQGRDRVVVAGSQKSRNVA